MLDAGAGYGRYRDLFKLCAYQAQDFGQYRGTQAGVMQDDWRYTKLDYECDITAIPAPDGSFDVILCTEVLEHLPAPILAVRGFARLLRPGGEVWLSAPLGSGLHQEPFHYYDSFTPHWYRRWLAKLESRIPVPELTVGYFVTATRI